MAGWSGARVWTYTWPPFGTKIGQVQRRVRVDHADDGDVGEVQPLGDHLRAEQDVDLGPGHALQHAVVRPLRAGRIQVHARDARGRKPQPNEMLQPLGPEPSHALALLAAYPAGAGDRLLVAAVMASQRRRRLVHGEGDRAMRALAHVP